MRTKWGTLLNRADAMHSDDQKAWRRHQRRADRENAKAIAAAGMFADVPGEVHAVTAVDMYWRWRRNKALAAENCADVTGSAIRGLKWIELQAIERWAVELLGMSLAVELIAHVRSVYPMPDYGPTVWCRLLSGQYDVVYRWHIKEGPDKTISIRNRDDEEIIVNLSGRTLIAEGRFPPPGWSPPITREQFWERFPYREPAPDPEPDDGRLFDRVMAAIRFAAVGRREATHGQSA